MYLGRPLGKRLLHRAPRTVRTRKQRWKEKELKEILCTEVLK